MHIPSTLAAVLVTTAMASVACNGRVEGDESGSTSSKAKRGAAEEQDAENHDLAHPAAPTSRSCTFQMGAASSSSGTGGNPLVMESATQLRYTCDDGEVAVECRCVLVGSTWQPNGECSCNGEIFPFDCSDTSPNAVSNMSRTAPTPEVYERCDVPAPPGSNAGGSNGSTSSSSG